MEEEEIFGLPQIKTLKIPDSGKLRFTSQSFSVPANQEKKEIEPTSFTGALLDKAEELGEKYLPEDGYFNSIVQGIKIGSQRASAADEIYNIFKGAKDNVSVEEFVNVMEKMNEAPQIESFNKWSASYDKYAEAIKKVPNYNNIKGDLAATIMAIKGMVVGGLIR